MQTEPLSASRRVVETRPPRVRSAVTNGTRLFVEGDGSSAWSRRYRDLIASHVGDLGGVTALSESQLSLVRRASAIECELEQMEGRLSRGESIDLDSFTRAASHLRRILETLGLERRPRDAQTLAEYLAARTTEMDAEAEEGESAPDLQGEVGTPAEGLPNGDAGA